MNLYYDQYRNVPHVSRDFNLCMCGQHISNTPVQPMLLSTQEENLTSLFCIIRLSE